VRSFVWEKAVKERRYARRRRRNLDMAREL
jgi:hypothetical protein